MNPNDNQGRCDRPQLPEGAGFVFWAVVGMGLWAAIFDVFAVVRGWV